MYKYYVEWLGREKVADLLIKNGAEVNKKDENGKTALHAAAENGNIGYKLFKFKSLTSEWFDLGHSNMLELLRKNGADPNITDKNGRTPAQSTANIKANPFCIIC